MKILVVIPAYNEEKTIRQVVEGALCYTDVFVTDDASKDSTPQILENLKVQYPGRFFSIRHTTNTHIPKGIRDGMEFALKEGYDAVITMDAGMSHNPEELPLFLSVPSEYELVIGKRKNLERVPLYRRFVSRIAAKVMNYCLSDGIFNFKGPGIEDCTSGFRRYSRRIFREIVSRERESVAFDFHLEALYIALSLNAKFMEVPIKYVFSNSSFNLKVLRQAMKYAWKLLLKKWKLSKFDY